ncbi:hypothetical protein EDC22_107131 [Tepidamorphus gemmatus]|uniref:Outer membrane surface antigen n=1 Tax=Tepidamorphus gemmatus TaxID=747076 RepID=A0A4R3M756_9HYPH|nr:hypothetical protein [Tepidamorphus gemmatus]TCT09284.1 hypothetical protein EDC22_107131 [Tepidamorphus gemmatus]
MATALIYRSRLPLTSRRRAACLLLAAIALAGGGCSIPISIPLGPLMVAPDETVDTASLQTAAIVDEGVAARLGEEAWEALRPAVAAAIAAPGPGHALAWRSATAPVSGTVTVIEMVFRTAGSPCRGLAITARADHRTDSFDARVCRSGQAWTVTPLDVAG